ncbi:MAG: triose-phosphate isomerase [Deltaproteobacteria bacterium]|nr:triose-phosphate isomerase [Deltaproteobacteria bacterium]
MIRPFIAANWKMYKTVGEAVEFVKQLRSLLENSSDRDVVIAPPFTALQAVGAALKGSDIQLSAQNLHPEEQGAFTGEISAGMLLDVGCRYVIIGHSERRHIFGEEDEFINKKVQTALQHGLKPIFCIGETLEERESGITFDILQRQIGEGLNNVSTDDIGSVTIAYEPVWAIGTGKTATPKEAQDAQKFIRACVEMFYDPETAQKAVIIYGGSVKPDNIGELMAQPDVNGALVGGASLDSGSFAKIVNYK